MDRKPRRRRGATLIEVLAGLVVLGTVLSAVVIARGRFVRQWAVAEQRTQAAKSTEALLQRWLSGNGSGVPIRADGVLDENHVWRTMPIIDENAEKLGAVVVRLDVYRRAVPQAPVLSMELLASKRPATQPAGRRA